MAFGLYHKDGLMELGLERKARGCNHSIEEKKGSEIITIHYPHSLEERAR
jgi:hypothetical protein